MITQVFFRPHVYSPGYNPIVWSVQSDKTSEIDMVYVFDIYINNFSEYSYRIKQRPNPVGAGMIDVSSIVTPHLNLTNFQAEQGATGGTYFQNSDEIVADIVIRVGEEYLSAGKYTIFNGVGYEGAPEYVLYSYEFPAFIFPNNPQNVRVIPASFKNEIGIQNLGSTASYGILQPYVMNATEFPARGKFLKNGGNTNYVQTYDHHTLTFLNWNDYASVAAKRPVQAFNVTWTGSTGPQSLRIDNLVSNGGGPQTSTAYTTATRTRETEMLTLKCGPKDLWPSGGVPDSYTITAFCKTSATSSTTLGATASESVTFTLKEYCEDIYPVVRLSWLNELGGRDYYNFDSFYEQTSKAKESTYSQTLLDWSSTTPVNVGGSNWLRGGDKSFNKTITREFTIMSDWLTQDEIDFLGGIPESPSVWAYIGDDPTPVTVTVTNLEYQYKKIKMVKLAQASFTVKINNIQIRQNL